MNIIGEYVEFVVKLRWLKSQLILIDSIFLCIKSFKSFLSLKQAQGRE